MPQTIWLVTLAWLLHGSRAACPEVSDLPRSTETETGKNTTVCMYYWTGKGGSTLETSCNACSEENEEPFAVFDRDEYPDTLQMGTFIVMPGCFFHAFSDANYSGSSMTTFYGCVVVGSNDLFSCPSPKCGCSFGSIKCRCETSEASGRQGDDDTECRFRESPDSNITVITTPSDATPEPTGSSANQVWRDSHLVRLSLSICMMWKLLQL